MEIHRHLLRIVRRIKPFEKIPHRPEIQQPFQTIQPPFGIAIAGEILLFTAKPAPRALSAGRAFGLLEAGKTVFPVKTPLDAELVEGNAALADSASLMNTDPYAAWLVRLRIPALDAAAHLLDWSAARIAITAQMDLWRFDDLHSFRPPLLGEAAKGLRE